MTSNRREQVAATARWLSQYDAFGLRRVGSAGDLACAAWLRDQLAGLGVAVDPVEVPLIVRTVVEAAVELPGLRIDGLPLFDAPDTAQDGLSGSLGPWNGLAPIGLLEVDPGAASIKGQPLESMRQQTRHAALILPTRDPNGELAPVNAQYYNAPFGPPALQVAGSFAQQLSKLAAESAPVRVIVRSERRAAHSLNLRATIDARADEPPLVLLTPRTSWFESTAERAGGIIAWRDALVHAATLSRTGRLACPVFGFATCGHELGHLGLEQVLAANAALLTDARLWIHLGANLGCASDGRVTVRASEPAHASRLRELLIANDYPATLIEVEPIERALGEARDLALHGARVLSIIGKNARFHAPSDRWPANVNAAWVASIGAAVREWLSVGITDE